MGFSWPPIMNINPTMDKAAITMTIGMMSRIMGIGWGFGASGTGSGVITPVGSDGADSRSLVAMGGTMVPATGCSCAGIMGGIDRAGGDSSALTVSDCGGIFGRSGSFCRCRPPPCGAGRAGRKGGLSSVDAWIV